MKTGKSSLIRQLPLFAGAFIWLASVWIPTEAQTPLTAQQQAFKERRQQEFEAFQLQRMQKFAAFKAKRNAELAAFRQRILEQWGEVDVSDQEKIVNYPEPEVKTIVDFENKEIVVNVLHDVNTKVESSRVVAALEALQHVTPEDSSGQGVAVNILKAYAANDTFDDLPALVDTASVEVSEPAITEEDLAKEKALFGRQQQQDTIALDMMADRLSQPSPEVSKLQGRLNKMTERTASISINQIKRNQSNQPEQLKNKRITRLTISIKPKELAQRIEEIKPYAKQYAETWQLPMPLIVAVIHTESSFNPLAVSHIPAYGLMQVVPSSAGIDVNDFLHNQRAPLEKEYLFVSQQNVEAGSAYLHILNSRYLRKIDDPMSRLYCAIAAYNTGVGNVAKAFNNGQSGGMSDAVVAKINAMSPDAVYDFLKVNLPYEETRRYLVKVKSRMEKYQNI